MKITKIETIPIRLPTRRVHQWASLTTPIGVYVIIKLYTDEGLIGLGEAPVLKDWGGDHGKYFGETPQTTMHIINDILSPALSGQDPDRIETSPIRLPTRRVHQWASLTTPIGVYVIIKLYTDEGLIGLGEAPVLKDWGGDHGKYFGETPQTTMHIINDILSPALSGQDPSRFEMIHAVMDRAVK